MKEFNEKAALRHIKEYLTAHGQKALPDDDFILDTVDAIWDAYDELGLLDADFDEEFDEEKIYLQEQEERRKVIAFVAKAMNATPLDNHIIEQIFDAENEYEETLL